ncbi:MAG TPA: FtsL-like putative cell division protein [Cytophagaceae bacterium]|jgi:hypothetical protein|nr:FtsL-like putative cell division protein [Cytophagaceae bacterium]
MSNSYKIEEEVVEEKKERTGKGLFSAMESLTASTGLFKDGLPVKYVPHLFYVSVFLIGYIWNAHTSDKLVRKISKMKVEVNDLRADYTTLKAELMFKSKQSEVAKEVQSIGLEESMVPPQKINLEEIEY